MAHRSAMVTSTRVDQRFVFAMVFWAVGALAGRTVEEPTAGWVVGLLAMMDLLSLREAYLPEPLPLAKRKRARMNSFHTGFHDVALPFASAPSVGAPETRTSASPIRTVTVGPGISPGQPALSRRVAGLRAARVRRRAYRQ